jgi:hypothetical protein
MRFISKLSAKVAADSTSGSNGTAGKDVGGSVSNPYNKNSPFIIIHPSNKWKVRWNILIGLVTLYSGECPFISMNATLQVYRF